MKLEIESLLSRPETSSVPGLPSVRSWRVALPVIIVAVIAIVALYWQTAASIVAIWSRSETFAHGYLIVPISAFLIWSKRRELASLDPVPDWLGLVLLAGAGIAWLVAAAGQAQVVQQYAMVAMIPAAVIAVTGRHVARAIAFPLGFLFFGVPIGEALVPPLMNWTADFTVTALQLTGIPVFREGTFFTIPSGNWSVVEGCSGLRYLIASITVGVLYAYLSYRTLWKRALFIGFSVVVPIIANGLRAYMIVMIAHLSDMKLALGVDHLIYGWVFFGLVMLLLFWIGSYWREDALAGSPETPARLLPAATSSTGKILGTAATAVVLAAAWPLYAAHLDRAAAAQWSARIDAPAGAAGWTIDPSELTGWRPRYEGASASIFQTYRKGDRTVVVYLGFYPHQRRGAELVTSTNVMVVQKHPVWSNVGDSMRTDDIGNPHLAMRQTRLRSTGQRLLIWDWYRISGRDLINPYLAKLVFARDRLLGRGDAAAAVILATDDDGRTEAAAETLREFVRAMKPSIDAALDRIAVGAAPDAQ